MYKKQEAEDKKAGRPVKVMDWKIIDAVLQYGATVSDCSTFCEMSEDSVQKRIKEKFGVTFTQYRASKMGKSKLKLRQKQYEMGHCGCRYELRGG